MSVLTGSTVWAREGFKRLSGMRVGLVANHTARLNNGTPTLAAMRAAGVDMRALFAPEHGAFGMLDDTVPDQEDPSTGLAIFSLYGEHKKPTSEQMKGLDALVFEIQDIGARFYTYSSTLGHCLEAAWEAGISLYVLDRPNPITGRHCEGPLADQYLLSFVAYHAIPIRHGLTLGELARLFCAEKGWGDTARVVPCQGWRRDMWWNETGLAWTNPSPAMRSLAAATLYPGVCLLEQTNISVGRGTDIPFTCAGAPFIDGEAWAAKLSALPLAGVTISPTRFTPAASKYQGEACNGVQIEIDDRKVLNSVQVGMALAATLRDLYGNDFDIAGVQHLLANQAAFDLLRAGADVETICRSWQADLRAWEARRRPHLLYS